MPRPRTKDFRIKSVSLSSRIVKMLEEIPKRSFSSLVEEALIDKYALYEEDTERRALARKLNISQETIVKEKKRVKELKELLGGISE